MTARPILKDQTTEFRTTERLSFRKTVEEHRDDVYNSLFDYFRNYTKFVLSPLDQTLIRAAFKLKKYVAVSFLFKKETFANTFVM
ncbi:hypothetical protein [Sphingobacterium sp. IITKGP-BTPF85]|uniref:hypothetical protein n=1 Tax=Sphingobacterium sp. IITKGP-BTPF85 TaxID=1338009 RepID=UPI00038A2D31|nr:hypothetical protein [Sphingobacterium sp. IITKGP-BTPF85]KKX49316.1 hypothetical protein L950_0216135 [Sphingobacterium sp. IITKGP-BTPF85]